MDPLRISMVGLSQWESVFVQTTVDLASGIDIASWRFVDDPDGADVLLVDADRQALKTINGDADRPIVVSFSADPTSGRGLTRPVSYASLISMLKEIEHELEQPPTMTEEVPALTLPDIALPEAEDEPRDPPDKRESDTAGDLFENTAQPDETLTEIARPARRFVEGTRFIGILQQIQKRGVAVEVTHPVYPTVRVFPGDNAFETSSNALAIPRMFRESAMAFTTRKIPDDVAAEVLATDRCLPLGRLLYCAALFGSEGRLVLNSDPGDKLRLTDWPDFNAVPHLPEHRTVARYMLVSTADLADIAAATDVSIRVVVDFCNACETVGLIRRLTADKGRRPRPAGIAQVMERMRSLFGNP